jgi:hypothetical protein
MRSQTFRTFRVACPRLDLVSIFATGPVPQEPVLRTEIVIDDGNIAPAQLSRYGLNRCAIAAEAGGVRYALTDRRRISLKSMTLPCCQRPTKVCKSGTPNIFIPAFAIKGSTSFWQSAPMQ